MKIECFMSLKCGSESALRDNIEKAMGQEDIKAEVVFRRIGDKEAQALGLVLREECSKTSLEDS